MQQDARSPEPLQSRTPLVVAVLVLALGILLTALAVGAMQRRIEDSARRQFNLQFDRLEASVRDQLDRPRTGLQALVGLFHANGRLTQASFQAWVASQDLNQQYLGVKGFGYLVRVPETGGTQPLALRALYFEPGQSAVGDATLPALHDTLAFISNTGQSALWPLSGSTNAPSGRAFLYLTPVYRTLSTYPDAAERLQALAGVVYAQIDLNELLLPSQAFAGRWADFDLIDGTRGGAREFIYTSSSHLSAVDGGVQADPLTQRRFSDQRTLGLGARTLELHAGSSAGFESEVNFNTPTIISVAGILLSGLLALFFWLLLAARGRAQTMALRMTADLNRLVQIVQRTNHLVFVGDAQHRIVWFNDAFSTFVDAELNVALGLEVGSLINLESNRSEGLSAFRNALARHSELRVQMPLTAQNGEQRWFDIDLRPETNARGKYTGFVVIAADITSQRAAADQVANAMRENEALLNAIDQHSIVSVTDPAGNIIFTNNMFSRISGYTREELLGKNHRILNSQQQPASYWTAMWKTISAGYIWRDTVCNRAKNGAHYWVDTVIAPKFDAAGGIEKYISVRSDVSQARHAQEDLQREREHLQAIVEGTHAGTWAWDLKNDHYRINARWASMLGYKLEELGQMTGARWQQFCHPDDQAAVQAAFERHFAGASEHVELEFRMQHHDGHWVFVQSRGKVNVWSAPGKPQLMSGIHLDVSQPHILQDHLHQNNQIMQSILENIPVALSVFNKELLLIAHNEKFGQVMEFPPELLTGPSVHYEDLMRFNLERGEFGDVEAASFVRERTKMALAPKNHHMERIRPNGTTLEIHGAPMPGGGFVTTYADITERKRAQAELQRTTSMLQSVLDSASEVAVITLDLTHSITLFNKGAQRMLGYAPHEVIGKLGLSAFFDAAEIEARGSALSAQLDRQVLGLQVVLDESVLGKRSEWTFIQKNGQRFAAALVVTPLTDATGTHTGYLAVSHDITQEKEHETRLQIATERAEQASTAKGQFLANMSHEIRTPMNAILGMLKLLQNTALDPRQQDYATKTESAARSLLGLLNDILDFSKAEAGKMELDLQPFDLDVVMRDLSVILSANVGTRGIEILFDVDARIPSALIGDSMRLQQVLINLGGNAIKFTEQGEVVISVLLQRCTARTATVLFSVRDSGIGIDAKHQQHIFSGFSQAESSTTRRFGGTGLGLSICQRLVSLMGSDLRLDSVLGQGSTFQFAIDLPLAEPLPTNHARAALAQLTREAPGAVLIVDNNPHARDCIATLARGLGWDATTCDSADAASRCISERALQDKAAFSVLLINWSLTDADCWQTAAQLKALQNAPTSVVIVMVTAHGRETLSQRANGTDAPWDGFLLKPMTTTMLAEAVVLARQHPSSPNAPGAGPATPRPRRLAGMRLLVVEDNLINQQVARELLGAEGALIDLAANGQLGVDAVARAQPQYDAVLMDLQLPIMDGYTASVTIRHELGLHDLPIIAMTANAMASDREACLAAGMNDHIGKPFDIAQLVDMLCRHTQFIPAPQAAVATATATTTTTAIPPAAVTGPAAPGTKSTSSTDHADNANADTNDWEGALQHLDGNLALYCDIGHAYLTEIEELLPLQSSWLTHQQLGEATRSLHTVKGLSLTVGAKPLSALCLRYEKELCKMHAAQQPISDTQRAELLAALRASVQQTSLELRAQLATWQPAPDAVTATTGADGLTPPECTQLVADLGHLRKLLDDENMESLEIHAALQQHYPGIADRLQLLQTAMSTFDFSKAVVQCDDLIREFGAHN